MENAFVEKSYELWKQWKDPEAGFGEKWHLDFSTSLTLGRPKVLKTVSGVVFHAEHDDAKIFWKKVPLDRFWDLSLDHALIMRISGTTNFKSP